MDQLVEEPLTLKRRPLMERVPATRVMRMVLEGEIGKEEMDDIGAMLFRLSMNGVVHLVVDMAGVTHLDYRGVKLLVRRAEVFRDLGGDVRLSGLSPYLFAIFTSAGARDSFDCFASLDDAVASFSRGIFVEAR